MTVYVRVKGVTARLVTVSKKTIYCGATKATNKKGNKLAKKRNKATEDEVTVCDDSGDDAGGGEGELWLIHLVIKVE